MPIEQLQTISDLDKNGSFSNEDETETFPSCGKGPLSSTQFCGTPHLAQTSPSFVRILIFLSLPLLTKDT